MKNLIEKQIKSIKTPFLFTTEILANSIKISLDDEFEYCEYLDSCFNEGDERELDINDFCIELIIEKNNSISINGGFDIVPLHDDDDNDEPPCEVYNENYLNPILETLSKIPEISTIKDNIDIMVGTEFILFSGQI